jgi:hypothetical protein
MNTNIVITESYRKMQQELHLNPNYGVASLAFAPLVGQIISALKIKSVSDYGAGKKNLLNGLRKIGIDNFQYFPYDPAFPNYGKPSQADLVCCIDVLEHVEPELIENVLDELATLVRSFGFFSIHTGPAVKVLSDGRNAHLIQEPRPWWQAKLQLRFEIVRLDMLTDGSGFWVIVKPKDQHQPS